jgi:hypothetical protein
MNPQAPENKQQTVVLAADVGSYSITTVNLAADMAASANTRLLGLFIEDEDLLQVSGLPCTREITLTTARERPTSAEQMQRALRSAAQQFKQALRQEAQALQITWSFDTIRGRIREISLEARGDVIYTILGQVESRQLKISQAHGPRRILLIGNHSVYLRHALEVLLRRFRHQKIEVVLVCDDSYSELPAAIARQGTSRDYAIKLVEYSRERLFDLLDHSGSTFDFAILSKHETTEETLRILRRIRCPVILVT